MSKRAKQKMKSKNRNSRKNTLWGGRFKNAVDRQVLDFSSSINFDCKLAGYDLKASLAHVKMLSKCKIIPVKEAVLISNGLKKLDSQLQSGKYKISLESEDIHTDIQNKLRDQIGPAANRLNTARSRNDQVSLSTRMYCRDKIKLISEKTAALQSSLLKLARDNEDVIMPGLTHMQHAQPVLLAHYLLAYIEMCERDKERLADAYKRVDVMPAGSCALAGTSLSIDRSMLAAELGFSKISANSIDAVSDRDFVIEIISCLAIIAMHLSRMSEDLIIMSSTEFSFVDIAPIFCTGSSLMPQKKNPDVLELIRGGAGRVYGDLTSVLVTMKGLPLSYNRDMQGDKAPLFNSLDFVQEELHLMSRLLRGLKINSVKMEKAVDEFSMATDLAEYLVKKGIAFRQAHEIVGRLVGYCLEKGKKIKQLPLEELRCFSPFFKKEISELIDAEVSVKNKVSYGGTGFIQVKRQLRKWEAKLNGGRRQPK